MGAIRTSVAPSLWLSWLPPSMYIKRLANLIFEFYSQPDYQDFLYDPDHVLPHKLDDVIVEIPY